MRWMTTARGAAALLAVAFGMQSAVLVPAICQHYGPWPAVAAMSWSGTRLPDSSLRLRGGAAAPATPVTPGRASRRLAQRSPEVKTTSPTGFSLLSARRSKKTKQRAQQASPQAAGPPADDVAGRKAGREAGDAGMAPVPGGGRSVQIRRSTFDRIMESLQKNKRASIKFGHGRRIAVVLDKAGTPVTADGRKVIKGEDIRDDSSLSEESASSGRSAAHGSLHRAEVNPARPSPRKKTSDPSTRPVQTVAGPARPSAKAGAAAAPSPVPASPRRARVLDEKGRTYLEPDDSLVAHDLSHHAPVPGKLDVIQKALAERVAQGVVAAEDAEHILENEKVLIDKTEKGEITPADLGGEATGGSASLEESWRLGEADEDVLGSSVSAAADEASAEEEGAGKGHGVMVGPWLVRFPKTGDVCFVMLKALGGFALDLKPVPVELHFIEAVKDSGEHAQATPAQVHDSVRALFGPPLSGQLLQERVGHTLVCKMVSLEMRGVAGADSWAAVKCAAGAVQLQMEWDEGQPRLVGKVGSKTFSSVHETEVLVHWSPKGLGGEEHEDEAEDTDERARAGGRAESARKDMRDSEGVEDCDGGEDAMQDEAGGGGLEQTESQSGDSSGVRGDASQKTAEAGHKTGDDRQNLAAAQRDAGGIGKGARTDVLVRSLAPRTRRADLRKLFLRCGRIRYVRLLPKKDARGVLLAGQADFALVEFYDEESATAALGLSKQRLLGSEIVVMPAKSCLPRSSLPGCAAAGAGGDAGGRQCKSAVLTVTQVPASIDQDALRSWLGGAKRVKTVGSFELKRPAGKHVNATAPATGWYHVTCRDAATAKRLVRAKDKKSIAVDGRRWRLRVHLNLKQGLQGYIRWSPRHKSQVLRADVAKVAKEADVASGFAIADAPLAARWWCEIRVRYRRKGSSFLGGLRLGVTALRRHPAGNSASTLPAANTWLLCDAPPAKEANRGRVAGCKDAAFRLSPGDTLYGKGVAQSTLADGDEVRVIRDGPRLSFAVNGIWLGEAFTTLPESGHLYLCTELKGRAAQVDIVGQGPW